MFEEGLLLTSEDNLITIPFYSLEIRAKDEFGDVPVVILSTSSRQTEIEDCLKIGANHYFVKPRSYEGMKQIPQTICSGSFN